MLRIPRSGDYAAGMDASTPIAPLRTDLDMVPVEHEGRTVVVIRDPLGLTPADRGFSLDLSAAPRRSSKAR